MTMPFKVGLKDDDAQYGLRSIEWVRGDWKIQMRRIHRFTNLMPIYHHCIELRRPGRIGLGPILPYVLVERPALALMMALYIVNEMGLHSSDELESSWQDMAVRFGGKEGDGMVPVSEETVQELYRKAQQS